MLMAIAHYYNDARGCFAKSETLARYVGCSNRWGIKLRTKLVIAEEIHVIEKGRGRGHSTVWGLAPKYVENMKSIASPFSKEKVKFRGRKGELSSAEKVKSLPMESALQSFTQSFNNPPKIAVRSIWDAQQRITAINERISKIRTDDSRSHYDRSQFKNVLNDDARSEIRALKAEREKLQKMVVGV